MTFSIIIPSYNESEDIRISIESALSQTVEPLEVLVVDDSSDNTRQTIKEYSDSDVTLVPGEHKGCCGARNLGMRRARGDIVVLLNADVSLPPDFLERISAHYDAGADYVLVESRVSNQEDALAAFVEDQHRWKYAGDSNIEWTEGFSARRAAVEKVGYIPGDFKTRFCRDWMLGQRLREAGFKKVIDTSIIVSHRAPAALAEYWHVRVARGRFGAFTQHYIYGHGRGYLMAKFTLKHALRLVLLATLVYPLSHSINLTRRSNRPLRAVAPFMGAYFLQELARVVGEWQGVLRIR
jgi:glycosyltransferase involved in cell wall biosynthesis